MRINSINSYSHTPNVNQKSQVNFGKFIGNNMQRAVLKTTVRNTFDTRLGGEPSFLSSVLCKIFRIKEPTDAEVERDLDKIVQEFDDCDFVTFSLNEEGQMVIRLKPEKHPNFDKLLDEQYIYGMSGFYKEYGVEVITKDDSKPVIHEIVNPTPGVIKITQEFMRKDNYYSEYYHGYGDLTPEEERQLRDEERISWLAQ